MLNVVSYPASGVTDAPADGERYIRRHNSWEPLPDTSTGQYEKGTNARIARPLAVLFEERINVRDFGAYGNGDTVLEWLRDRGDGTAGRRWHEVNGGAGYATLAELAAVLPDCDILTGNERIDRIVIQHCINLSAAMDRSLPVYIPAPIGGPHYEIDAPLEVAGKRIILHGDGPASSILRVTDGGDGKDFNLLRANRAATPQPYVELRGLRFEGGLYHAPTKVWGDSSDGSHTGRNLDAYVLLLRYTEELVMEDCAVAGGRFILLRCTEGRRRLVRNCRFEFGMFDGCSLNSSKDTIIEGCTFRHIADDAISVHCFHPDQEITSRIFVRNCSFFDAHGVVTLGPQQVSVTGCHFSVIRGRAIYLGIGKGGSMGQEGNRTIAHVVVSDNTITDVVPAVFTQPGASREAYGILVWFAEWTPEAGYQPEGDDTYYPEYSGLGTHLDGTFRPPWYFTQVDPVAKGKRGGHQYLILNNTIGRLRPNGRPSGWMGDPVITRSQLPDGLFCKAVLDNGGTEETWRTTHAVTTRTDDRPGSWVDPVLSEQARGDGAAFRWLGINLEGPCTGLLVAHNTIDGQCNTALRWDIRAPGWAEAMIVHNQFRHTRPDAPLVDLFASEQRGTDYWPSANGQCRLYLAGNYFEADPYFHPENGLSVQEDGGFINDRIVGIRVRGVSQLVMGPGNQFARMAEMLTHDAFSQVHWLDGQLIHAGHGHLENAAEERGVKYKGPNGSTTVWPQFRVLEHDAGPGLTKSVTQAPNPHYLVASRKAAYVTGLTDLPAAGAAHAPSVIVIGLLDEEAGAVDGVGFTVGGAPVDLTGVNLAGATNVNQIAAELAKSPSIARAEVQSLGGELPKSGGQIIVETAAAGAAGIIAVAGAGPLVAGAVAVGTHQIAIGALRWWAGEVFTLTDGRRFRCTGSGDGTTATFAWLVNG